MRLTDSQLVILNAAAQREGGMLLPLPKSIRLNKGAATLVMKSLLKHKLVKEENAAADDDAWREENDGRRFALLITAAGLKAIGVEDGNSALAKNAGPKVENKAKGAPAKAPSKKPSPDKRAGTKLSVLVDLLKRKTGATIEEAAKATGWQRHSVRGAISGALKKKMRLTIDSAVEARGRVYRIAG